jgi:hypothetical protein
VNKKVMKAVAHLGTPSRTNIGADKDRDKRQRAAIDAYAKASGYAVIDTYYDAAVSGADPVVDRPGFTRYSSPCSRMALGRSLSKAPTDSPATS